MRELPAIVSIGMAVALFAFVWWFKGFVNDTVDAGAYWQPVAVIGGLLLFGWLCDRFTAYLDRR